MAEITDLQATEIKKFQHHIDHSNQVVEYLREGEGVIIVGVTGPSAVGTTTLIRHSGLYKVPGFTSRPPRYEGEAEIRFYEQTPSFIDECIDRCKAGELVQIRLSDEGYIYGSEIDDYKKGELNVVDMIAGSILDLYDLPFREIRPIVVVCDADQWERRFLRDRGEFANQKERIWNDISSLKMVVEEEGGDREFAVIVNNDNEFKRALRRFKLLAHGNLLEIDWYKLLEMGLIRDTLLGRMALVAS